MTRGILVEFILKEYWLGYVQEALIMGRADTERDSGELIGWAVMVLMDRNEGITLTSVLKVLTDFTMKAFSTEQLSACTLAITDVKSAIAVNSREKATIRDKELIGTDTYHRYPDIAAALH